MARYFLVIDTEKEAFSPGSEYELMNVACAVGGRMTIPPAVWGSVETTAYRSFEDLQSDWREGTGAFESEE